MNKKQKQLIDTYFRKREIVAEVRKTSFETHENMFLIKQNKKPFFSGVFRSEKIVEILSNNPSFVDMLPLDKIGSDGVRDVLLKQSSLIKKLPINRLNGGDVGLILEKHPNLVDYLPIEKMGSDSIRSLLIKQPPLVNKLPTKSMVGKDIMSVLRYQPSLIGELPIEKMSNYEIKVLLHLHQPELRGKFEERGMI